MSAYLDELRDVIRRLHGVEATHVKSVPVKEMFGGQTVWDGIVEVFDLHGHPNRKVMHGRTTQTTQTIRSST